MTIKESGFDASPVPQILIDADGDVAGANRRARDLFKLGPEDLAKPLQDLRLSYHPLEIRSRIDTARSERRTVIAHDVEWVIDGETTIFDVFVVPILDPGGTVEGVSVSFVDVTAARRLREETEDLRSKLANAQEELHSTNEELETINEELQSTNDELESLNDHLRVRTEAADEATSALEAILTGLQSAVVVLTQELVVQVWNRQAHDLWGLREDEVVGEHFLYLDIGLPVEELRQPIRGALSEPEGPTDVALRARDRRGREIDCRVRVAALRRANGEITGAILLMDAIDHTDAT